MQPIGAEILVEDSSIKTILKTASDSVSGKYAFRIPNLAYILSVVKKGYVLLNNFIPDQLTKNYGLQTLKSDVKIVFYNIRFCRTAQSDQKSDQPIGWLMAMIQ